MLNPDIEKAIEIIDRRIESLRSIRDSLLEEYGASEGIKNTLPAFSADRRVQQPANRENDRTTIHPSTRKQIASETGISEGKVSWALNDKNRFQRQPEGWVALSDLTAKS